MKIKLNSQFINLILSVNNRFSLSAATQPHAWAVV
jgi:hypothetical protein